MKIPEDPIVWIVFIVVVGLVIGLGLWLGRGIIFRRNKDGLSLEIREAAGKPKDDGADIRVVDNVVLEDVIAGDITGAMINGDGHDAVEGKRISVLNGAKAERLKVGDITGIKITKK